MPRTKVTFDIVREIGLTLPDVEEGTMYGSPALKVCGSLLTCMAINKSAEPESLVVAIDFDQRSGLLAEAPETYHMTDHYVDYPVVLVRLSQIRIDQLRDLLGSAWRFVTAQKRRTASPPVRGKLNRPGESHTSLEEYSLTPTCLQIHLAETTSRESDPRCHPLAVSPGSRRIRVHYPSPTILPKPASKVVEGWPTIREFEV